MRDKIVDRCKVICGGVSEDCIMDNTRHLDCIADMVINKTSGISLLLGKALREYPNEAAEEIRDAMTILKELSNWVKYLQVTRNLKQLNALQSNAGISDVRKVTRYPLPDVYEKYISMKVTLPGRSIPVSIIDFCQRGAQFKSPDPIEPGIATTCTLSTQFNIKKEVHCSMTVKYCSPRDGGYLIGAHVTEVDDSSDFNFFNNIYNFIIEIQKEGHHFGG
jgi:hypothetical protein